MQTLKSLLLTALILGGGFLAYDRYLAPDADKLVFRKQVPAAQPAHTAASSVAPPQAAADATPASPTTTPAILPSPKPEAGSATMPEAASAPGQPPNGFLPPKLSSVEQATLNWMRIPPTAFPRQVCLLKAVSFKAGFGSTQVAAGSQATVLSAKDGTLTIAPNAASTLRATLPIEATDLKSVLTQVYESWRGRRVADARLAWEERDKAPPAPPSPATLDAAGRPQRGADGGYPLLLASMKSGAVTEITPQSVTHWGDAQKDVVNGKPCWIVPVEFDSATAFGKFHTEAVAKVVDGRVAGWYYKGSGEQVP